MKKTLTYLIILSIATSLLYFFTLKSYIQYLQRGESVDTLAHTTIYVYDTTKRIVFVPQEKIVLKNIVTIDTFLIHNDTFLTHHSLFIIDTNAVVEAWLTKIFYYENEIRDTNIAATIADSIYQNKIIARTFTYQLLKPTQVISNTFVAKPHPKNKLYAGAGIGLSASSVAFTPSLLLVTKSNRAFSVNTNVFAPQPNIGFGAYFPIFQPKP